MKKISNPSRLLALVTAGVLSAGVMLHPVPARADKAKNYKTGAIALGLLGGYLISKGKTTAGAAVLGAGAYTYKKGEDARKADNNDNYRDRYGYRNDDRYRNDNRYDDRYRNDNRDRYPNDNRNDDRYRNDNRDRYANSDSYGNRYNVPARNRLSDDRNSYRVYRNDDRYGNRYDDRYDDRSAGRYDDRSNNRNRNPKIR